MSWIEISTNATYEAVDWIRTTLSNIDYLGDIDVIPIETEQRKDAEKYLRITLHVLNDSNARKQFESINQALSGLQRTGLITELEVKIIEELDNLKDSSVHKVGKQFVILNSANDYSPSNSEILIKLDPSLAFGSGLHPATMLALQLIEKYITPGMRTLDLGCGSGILSIAMAQLGAQVLAVDNDRAAVNATQIAVQQNKVTDQVTVMAGSLGSGSNLGHWMGGELQQEIQPIQPEARFNLIAANLLGRIHVELANEYYTALQKTDAHNGLLITAGFTSDYEDELNQTFAEVGFEQIDCDRIGEWTALVHRISS